MENKPPEEIKSAPGTTHENIQAPSQGEIALELPALTGLSSEVVRRRRSGGSAGAVPAKGRRFWEDFPLPSATTHHKSASPED